MKKLVIALVLFGALFTVGQVAGQPGGVTINLATPSAVSGPPGGSFTYTTNWSGGPTSVAYEIFVHFTDAKGNIIFQDDHSPTTPTTQWTGGPYADTARTVTIPATLAAGTYNIMAGLFNSAGRLTLTPGSGVVPDNQTRYQIGTLTVQSGQPGGVTINLATPSAVSGPPGGSFTYTTNWSGGPTSVACEIFVHFTDAKGNIIFQDDHSPTTPTTQWTGGPYADTARTVTIPATLAAGTYNIMAGLFNSAGRLTLTPGSGVVSDNQTRYQIGTLTVQSGQPGGVTINLATPSAVSGPPGGSFTYTTNWSGGPTSVAYEIFVHFTDAKGNIIFQDDHSPTTPTTQWTGGPYADTARTVTIPATLAAGTYNIMAGLFNSAGRLTLTPSSGVVSDNQTRYQIGTLTVQSGQPGGVTINLATPSAVSGPPGGSFTYTTNWSGGPTSVACEIFVHFTDAKGNIIFQDDHSPTTPTTQWTGGPYADTARTVTIPATLAAGTYNIMAGLFNSAGRLTLTPGSGVVSDNQTRYQIGTLTVGGPITTYHYDNFRTGWRNSETSLTAASFPSNFGIIATATLDDQVDAQPLIVPNQTVVINGVSSTHDVVYVATESDTVYAIDASSGQILLSTSLGSPVSMPLGCTNNGPHVGITGTPVIDPNSQTVYVIAYVNSSSPSYQLHALNLSNLQDTVSPVTVTASHTLTDGSTYTFNATYQRQRPGLLELNGNIYAGFGSFCDLSPQFSRGWLLGWNVAALAPLAASQLDNQLTTATLLSMGYPSPTSYPANTPPLFLSSIFMSGYGIASDGTYLYVATGNSDCNWTVQGTNPTPPCPKSTTWTGTTNIQESVARFSGSLTLSGVFTPSTSPNTYAMDQADLDLSSGGVLLFPTENGTYPYLAVAGGKDGRVFLLNPSNLGTPTSASPPTSTPPPLDIEQGDRCWCGPDFFIGSDGINRVVTSGGSTLRTWQVQLSPTPHLVLEGTASISPSDQDGGFFTSVSSNGTIAGSAIIWAVGRPTGVGSNPTAITLYAFAAVPPSGTTTLKQLFSATAGSWPNTDGNANIVPVVSNGKVYVASAYLDSSGNTRGQLNIFGIGGTGKPLASAVAAPVSHLLISGTIAAGSSSTLTLKTRGGGSVTIDFSEAKQNQRIGAHLKVGAPVTVLGSTIEANGAMLAKVILRAKGASGALWPPDRQ